MTIFTLVRAELARLVSSKLGIASLAALMTVPLFYGGLYLWGNHDPYSNLKNVPAAVVVSDSGATVDGKAVNYGSTAAKSLLKGEKFGWTRVSKSEAASGVKNGRFDFALEFPPSFSSKLASAAGADPVAAAITLTTDDTNSYLSTTIAKQAAEAVRVEIAREVGATAANQLLSSVSSIRDGLATAQGGATQLADGAASAASGATTLVAANAALASGSASLARGLKQLDTKTSALPAGTAQLAAGSGDLAAKLAAAAKTASTIATFTGQAAATTKKLATDAAAAGITDPAVLADIQALSLSVPTADANAGGLAAALPAASAGAAQLASGASALNASAPALAAAVHSGAAGASSLAGGAAQASSGAATLSGGLDQLASGSKTLAGSIGDAVTTIPKTSAGGRTTAANLIANPLAVRQDAITEAQDYGAGLAPFFLSLSSWIGIYALFLIVRPLSRRALTAVRRPIRTMLAGWLTPAILGVVQMIALFVIVTAVLHLNIANPIGLLGFLAFVAVTFAAIVLALNVLLGSVGQFLALVFMVVQLVVAGGTFPWQTLPAPLRALHQVLPMGHAVDGVRQLMYGGLSSSVWSAVLPLLYWLVGSLLLATLGALRQGRFRTLRELRPSAIGA